LDGQSFTRAEVGRAEWREVHGSMHLPKRMIANLIHGVMADAQ
jgi:hypothetical protein